MIHSDWFPFETERIYSDKILFCFHHAGGTASLFRNWMRWSNDIEVVSVELPGKATRIKEAYATDLSKVAEEVANEIIKMTEGKKVWLYGHSMGAVLAFSVASNIEKMERKVEKLIVSGRHAPIQVIKDNYCTDMGDDVLISELKRVGGTPNEFLESPEMLNIILPPIKADYKLNESYSYDGTVLNCDICGFAGSDDADAPRNLMEQWEEVTKGDFYLEEKQGTHFFPSELGESFWKRIEEEILHEIAQVNSIRISENYV